MTFRADKHPIGTICFPSYNRGKILLKSIKELLPKLSSQWPVLVVDNASNKDREEYKEIEILAESSSCLCYFRHKKNGLFEGNLLSLFDLVQTQFFLVVSDEDFPSIEALDQMVPFLKNNKDIGGIRTRLGTLTGVKPAQAVTFNDIYYNKGEGITAFGLTGNYITGQIYNAPLLNKLNIPQRLKKNIHANQWYPHLYLNVLAAANSPTLISSSITCYEGTTDAYRPEETKDYFGPFSYGTRVDQFIALRNAIYEGYTDMKNSSKTRELDITGFYNSYFHLCSKWQMLIFMAQGKMYKDQMINLDFLSNSFSLLCISSVAKLPNYERIKHRLAENIIKSGQHYLELRQNHEKALTAAQLV